MTRVKRTDKAREEDDTEGKGSENKVAASWEREEREKKYVYMCADAGMVQQEEAGEMHVSRHWSCTGRNREINICMQRVVKTKRRANTRLCKRQCTDKKGRKRKEKDLGERTMMKRQ